METGRRAIIMVKLTWGTPNTPLRDLTCEYISNEVAG